MEVGLQEQLKILTDSIKDLTKSHEGLKKEVQTSCENSKKSQEGVLLLTKKTEFLERKLDFVDRKDRSNNIILFNLEDNEENNANLFSTIISIFTKINTQIPELAVADVYRIGKNIGNRPVMVKFIAPRWVKIIFSKIDDIRNMKLGIAYDRSKEERDFRRDLRAKAEAIKNTGRDVSIQKNNLIIDGKIIKGRELDTFLSNVLPGRESQSNVKEDEDPSFTILRSSLKKGPGRRSKKEIENESSKNTRMDSFLTKDIGTPKSTMTTRSRGLQEA